MLRSAIPFAVTLACAGFASSAGAQTTPPTFGREFQYLLAAKPESAAIGDFNSDGRKDVAMTTSSFVHPGLDFVVCVYFQNASGTLGEPPVVRPTHGVTSDLMTAGAADFNGDGATDLAVCTSAGIDVYIQRNHRLGGPTLFATPAKAFEQDVADVNGDGRPDIAVRTLGGVFVFVNTGQSFQLTPVTSFVEKELEIGDVTGDGLADIVSFGGTSIHVYEQHPGGTWSGPTVHECNGGAWPLVKGIGIGDVTGDGRADVVAAAGGLAPGLLCVFAQLPNGTLANPVLYPTDVFPWTVEVADLDGDGRNEVIVLHAGGQWKGVGIYNQDSLGALMPERFTLIPQAIQYGSKAMDIGDLTNDGLADIAIAQFYYGGVGGGLVVLPQLP